MATQARGTMKSPTKKRRREHADNGGWDSLCKALQMHGADIDRVSLTDGGDSATRGMVASEKVEHDIS